MGTNYDRKMVRQQLKKHAKAVLHRDLWGNIALSLPLVIIFYLSSALSYWSDNKNSMAWLLFSLVILLIFGVLTIYTSYVQMYQSIKQFRDESTKAQPGQSWFKTYLTKYWQKRLWLSFWMVFLFLLGWGILIFIGQILFEGSFIIVITGFLVNNTMYHTFMGLMIIGLAIYFIFSIISLMKWYKYILVPYIGYNDSSLSGFQMIAQSRKIMTGRRWEIFVMNLSFFWWILLTIFTLGLAGLYTIPYMTLTFSGYFDEFQQQDQALQESLTNTETALVKPIILKPKSINND